MVNRAVGSLDCDELIKRLKSASWPTAIANLRSEWERGGDAATRFAEEYGNVYRNVRAAMVFDCVMSRQRRYTTIVLPLVEQFKLTLNSRSLQVLAEEGPGLGGPGRTYPFRRGDAEAIRQVAAGLVRYCNDEELGEEAGVRAWADEAARFERRWFDDPYVGSVRGVGIATFAYLRMRCGADAIKPDVRVHSALGSLLLPLGDGSDLCTLCVAGAAAEELGVSRLQLDQLLWWMDEND
jgi:hypothetical protein